MKKTLKCKIIFKNFMDARVNFVILPIAQKLMQPAQAAKASGDGYMAGTLPHEICHGLGREGGKQMDIREAIGPAFSGLEEAKADVVGMFGLKWLVDHDALPKDRLQEYYSSYVAGIFRTLRFGTGDSASGGRYTIDYARMPAVVAALAKVLLAIEATGDRDRAETWFAKYDKMPAELKTALEVTKGIPVDIQPIYSFKD